MTQLQINTSIYLLIASAIQAKHILLCFTNVISTFEEEMMSFA